MQRFIRYLTVLFAPYAVVIVPTDRRFPKGVVHTWTVREAIEWVGCALRDDHVFIVRRATRLQKRKLLASRKPVVEVTYE